jgi:transposase
MLVIFILEALTPYNRLYIIKHTEHPSIKDKIMAKIINPNAAGIDVSSREHFVAVPEGRSSSDVRCFPSYTQDLHKLAKWLIECQVNTVAMESTGVYWFHLYTILLDYGIEVYLVNAYHVKNVPGRKSDVSDARWLQELHSLGMLRSCFQPDNLTRSLRTYVRQRKTIVKEMATQIQRMQKALEQMNIKLSNVIRDISGKTGLLIIQDILNGETDANALAQHRDPRIKASKEVLLKSLEGNWRQEQIFNLGLAYNHYHFLRQQLQSCDMESEKVLSQIREISIKPGEIKPLKARKNQPDFNVAQYLYQSLGVDVTKIFGFKQTVALTVFSETGSNLKEKFPTEKQFLSWLNVVPDNKISGGKIISSRIRKKKNIAGQAFRDAANTLWNAKNPIGDYIRSKKSKSGAGQAVVATARKLASIYYKMVTEKVEFDPYIIEGDRKAYLKTRIKKLELTLSKSKELLNSESPNLQVVI